ncbi:MAG TPA: hypothetical protein VH599_10770 [Ktedonobacterales bacterium]|jgi:hypothetical protein
MADMFIYALVDMESEEGRYAGIIAIPQRWGKIRLSEVRYRQEPETDGYSFCSRKGGRCSL